MTTTERRMLALKAALKVTETHCSIRTLMSNAREIDMWLSGIDGFTMTVVAGSGGGGGAGFSSHGATGGGGTA